MQTRCKGDLNDLHAPVLACRNPNFGSAWFWLTCMDDYVIQSRLEMRVLILKVLPECNQALLNPGVGIGFQSQEETLRVACGCPCACNPCRFNSSFKDAARPGQPSHIQQQTFAGQYRFLGALPDGLTFRRMSPEPRSRHCWSTNWKSLPSPWKLVSSSSSPFLVSASLSSTAGLVLVLPDPANQQLHDCEAVTTLPR